MKPQPKPPKERRKRKHKDSILQSGKKCFITDRTDQLHEHHIFYGRGQREISESNGFKVWITYDMHNGNDPMAIHNNPGEGYDKLLKELCQRAYEELGHSRDEFIALIGRSYL